MLKFKTTTSKDLSIVNYRENEEQRRVGFTP